MASIVDRMLNESTAVPEPYKKKKSWLGCGVTGKGGFWMNNGKKQQQSLACYCRQPSTPNSLLWPTVICSGQAGEITPPVG